METASTSVGKFSGTPHPRLSFLLGAPNNGLTGQMRGGVASASAFALC